MQILNENKQSYFVDMLEDSCVKHFEYTLEISWKLMKRVLKNIYGKSEIELTVNNIFRFMHGYNFIDNSYLPYVVNIVDFKTVDDNFCELIQQNLVKI